MSAAAKAVAPRRAARHGATEFISWTWEMINAGHENIHWSADGKAIVVSNPERLATAVLPLYFRRSQYSSWVRALNAYGFRKVGVGQWEHPDFQRDRPERLKQIVRKAAGTSSRRVAGGHTAVQNSTAIVPMAGLQQPPLAGLLADERSRRLSREPSRSHSLLTLAPSHTLRSHILSHTPSPFSRSLPLTLPSSHSHAHSHARSLLTLPLSSPSPSLSHAPAHTSARTMPLSQPHPATHNCPRAATVHRRLPRTLPLSHSLLTPPLSLCLSLSHAHTASEPAAACSSQLPLTAALALLPRAAGSGGCATRWHAWRRKWERCSARRCALAFAPAPPSARALAFLCADARFCARARIGARARF